MSENKFNVYVEITEDKSGKLSKFIQDVQSKNFEALSYASEYFEVDKHLDIDLSASESDGIHNLKFYAWGSLVVENFISFLFDELGAITVEAAVFIGDCGEYDFHFADEDEEDSFTEYDEHEWNWLEDPSIDWESENIVLSGKFENYETRDELADELIDLGANVQSSISKKTTLLITGNKVGASKLNKANELSIRIISESELMEIIECV
ncbi:BRCT domain-containing protein [Shewanella japonica]|uniref:BRCT domain protein n=1 Tax=Shewanella japonica TaxID=93973 RepID=A0ABN4YFC3_9GAMM|nr:BRCT domain-containing protein [Shewanella japonica]ARD22971.1 BRCT domain protein [Shewanella japonica]